MKMPENAKLHQRRLFHCLITFSSEIDIRLVFGRAAQRHNNVPPFCKSKNLQITEGSRICDYIKILPMNSVEKKQAQTDGVCLLLVSQPLLHSHLSQAKVLQSFMKIAGARCEGEEGKWEVGAATKKKKRSSLTTLHSLFFHCVSHCMHFLSSVILITSPPFPPSFCRCRL